MLGHLPTDLERRTVSLAVIDRTSYTWQAGITLLLPIAGVADAS